MVHINRNKIESEEKFQKLPVDPTIANEFVSGEVASWEGVRVQEHVNGRVGFWLNNHCLGYLQDPPGEIAIARLKFHEKTLHKLSTAQQVQNQTIDKKEAFGWITASMGTVLEVTRTIDLFRHRYKQAVKVISG